MEPKKALEILSQVIMKRVQGTGEEHAFFNQALNALHALVHPAPKSVPPKENK